MGDMKVAMVDDEEAVATGPVVVAGVCIEYEGIGYALVLLTGRGEGEPRDCTGLDRDCCLCPCPYEGSSNVGVEGTANAGGEGRAWTGVITWGWGWMWVGRCVGGGPVEYMPWCGPVPSVSPYAPECCPYAGVGEE